MGNENFPLTVVQLVPALGAGGAERSTLEISRALVAAGHKSIVVSAGGRLVPRLQGEGGEHLKLDLGRKSLSTLRHVRGLRAILLERAPHIVHARSRLPAWIARLAFRGVSPRPHFVTTVHGLNRPSRYSAVLARGERVICVSETVRAHLLAHYTWLDPAHLAVVPRGIDPAEFPFGHRPEPAWRNAFLGQHPALAGVPLLTMPARGTRLKNHADAIRLLAQLRDAHRIEAGLLLLGAREPGRERYVRELEALARKLGVAGRVAIAPPRADIRDVYGASAAVLQLSARPESFGRTVVEALALGVPVVGYAHGGVGELLRDLYPEGAIAPGAIAAAADLVAAVIVKPPDLAPLARYRLADMQAATLAVYADVMQGERA
jgi:glycosyltransferase involved in cell wall biosynthesis